MIRPYFVGTYIYIAVGRYRRAEPFFLRQQQQTDGGASGGFENKGQASKGFFFLNRLISGLGNPKENRDDIC